MNKTIAIITSVMILISSICVSFASLAEEYDRNKFEDFAEACIEIANEYDDGKKFQIVEEALENDDLRFQTGRLFVKCASSFNKMDAEEKVSGFLSWHLLQYASPQEAKKAYEYYLKQEKIECVEPDVLYCIKPDGDTSEYITKEDALSDNSRSIMGFDEIFPYVSLNHYPAERVKVGVLDSGIDYTHEIFENRIFRTYTDAVNNSDDEFDTENAKGHGTSVSSCIVMNTPASVKVGCYKTLEDKGEDTQTKVSRFFHRC